MLGGRLSTTIDGLTTTVIVCEVEAYGGSDDAASHARNGPTARNAAMFGPAGTLYVYRAYGLHWCVNVATGGEGHGSAVLIRGGIPVLGQDTMVQRRGRSTNLADGPGKLTQALGMDRRFDGARARRIRGCDGDLFSLRWRAAGGKGEALLEPRAMSPVSVEATARIGISREVERPWRFVAAF